MAHPYVPYSRCDLVGIGSEKLMTWGDAESQRLKFPDWAVADEVLALCRKDFPDGCIPLTLCCGPAVLWALAGVLNQFMLWLLVPIFAYYWSDCPEDGKGIAPCTDVFIWVYFVFVCAPVHFYCQAKCVSYIAMPQLAATGRFEFLGFNFNRHSFWIWFLVLVGVTTASLTDTATNGVLLGRVFKTTQCESYTEIQDLWARVMGQSFITRIPGLHHSEVWRICLVSYLLVLVQPLFAIAYCTPWPLNQGVDYSVGEDSPARKFVLQYTTLYSRVDTNHGMAVQVAASMSRMEAVSFQNQVYTNSRMDRWANSRVTDWEVHYLSLSQSQLHVAIAKFICVGLAQNAIQTNVQTTLVGANYDATGSLDLQMLFSVIMCLTGTLGDFPDALEVLSIVAKALKGLVDVDRASPKAAELYSRIQWALLRFLLYLAVYLAVTLWSVLKLVAIFACPHHLWNWHRDFLSFSAGCAG
mmetsp:Transcript_33759/g.93271  ORF Transcript_33759/g.93271 Transcript_33759/m.93271 type:complete len:469 (-) Transcript_33759:133-1539(-)